MRHVVAVIALLIALLAILLGVQDHKSSQQRLTAQEQTIQTVNAEVSALSAEVAHLQAMAIAPPVVANAPPLDEVRIKELIQTQLQALNLNRPPRQGGGGGFNPDPAAMQRRLQDQLGLEEAKATQVAALIVAEMNDLRPLFTSGASRDEIQAKMKEERVALEAKTANILSPDEQTKFKAYLDQREAMFTRGRQRQNGGQPPGAGAPGQPGAPAGGAGAAPGGAPAPETKPNSF